MSGSSIGSTVGFFVGNAILPGLGGAIGSTLGGAIGSQIAPDVINGPSIGDAQTQTSQAGVPRPIVFGHPAPFAGNLIDGEVKARKIIKKQRQGKGGGPVVKEEHFILTYAVRMAEPIGGLVRAKRQGKPVYDARPLQSIPGWDNPDTASSVAEYYNEMQAANAKFLASTRIYLGGEDQLPDPALEMLHGVGNTPYYRGTSYMVREDEDVTDVGGVAPAWTFECVSCGVPTMGGNVFVSAKSPPPAVAYHKIASVSNEISYTSPPLEAIWNPRYNPSGTRIYGANLTSAKLGFLNVATNVWTDFDAPHTNYGIVVDPSETFIYSMDFDFDTFRKVSIATGAVVRTITGASVGGASALAISPSGQYVAVIGGAGGWRVYDAVTDTLNVYGYMFGGDGVCISANGTQAIFTGGNLDTPGGTFSVQVGSLSDGSFVDELIIPARGRAVAAHPNGATIAVACYSTTQNELWIVNLTSGLVVATVPLDFGNHEIAYNAGGTRLYATNDVAGSVCVIDVEAGSDTENEVIATVTVPLSSSVDGGIAVWPATIIAPPNYLAMPDAPDSHVDPATSEILVTDPVALLFECGNVTLQEVEEEIAARCNVPAGKFDASALADIILPGYLIARQATGAECLRPLCQAYFHDLPEPDGIYAVLRGGAAVEDIVDAQLLLAESEPLTTGQSLEYPLKVTVITQHPEADYAPIPQTSERYSPDVNAASEFTLTVPVPLPADETMAIAVKLHNVLWSRAEGTEELPLPRTHGHLIPSDAITRNGRRWLIEDSNRADRNNKLQVVYDRESNYHAVVTGNTPAPPTPPGSGLIGPTVFEFLNLPLLADAHDKIGFYVAVKGLFSAWNGGVLLGSLDTGASWVDLADLEDVSVMGSLLTALPAAPAEVVDELNTVRVQVGRGELDSITFEELLQEKNACVIGDEICQFQTATLVSPGIYDLSVLSRGRLDTTPEDHAVGARFVLLDAPIFVEMPSSWIGRTFLLKAVSNGTSEEANASRSVTWSPARSQTEWAPVGFVGARDAFDNLIVSWNGRGRLGTTASPYHSVNFVGYRVVLDDGVLPVATFDVAEPNFRYDATALGSPLTVSIAPLNRITGAGPALVGSI